MTLAKVRLRRRTAEERDARAAPRAGPLPQRAPLPRVRARARATALRVPWIAAAPIHGLTRAPSARAQELRGRSSGRNADDMQVIMDGVRRLCSCAARGTPVAPAFGVCG
jgi:hypothetical protein